MRTTTFAAAACGVALGLLAGAPPAPAADPAPLPALGSLPDEAFTDSEREALTAWVLARPEVQSALGASRTRVVGVFSDHPKGPGGQYRRGSVWLRRYDTGTTLGVSVNLSTGAVEVDETDGLIQPDEGEIEDAIGILRADGAFDALFADARLTLMGGFFNRSTYADDPCRRDICLELAFMKPSFEKEPARRMVVNMTRRVVANRDFKSTLDPQNPPRMTAVEGGAR